jgi:hypothetical protein
MAKRRKSKGGRPRNPNKKVVFTLRLEPQVLAELKARAQTWQGGNGNVSKFTEFLLDKGLHEREEDQRDPALRALLFFIAELAERVSGGFYPEKARPELLALWRTDPFRFSAFKVAVRKLLDVIEEPPGEIKSPFNEGEIKDHLSTLNLSPEDLKYAVNPLVAICKSPENFGAAQFISLWKTAHSAVPLTDWHQAVFSSPRDKSTEREFYGLPKALRDLKLKSKKDKPEGNSND